ncbi:protein TsetseEP [Drosophila subobscura]|uniref:protein TsetseEP n=1 Tax=Drosophila subobscura TaxID=7241 RepID=UPI00155A93C5|nr:protein TsetseEP [Drosophila subobscura]
MQQGILVVAVLLACLAASCSSTAPPMSPMTGHSRMLQLMSATSQQQKDNPTLSIACFQYYSGEFDKHLKQYEYEYDQCQQQASEQNADLFEKYNYIVTRINNETLDSCKALTDCTYQATPLASLDCYSAQGSEAARSSYNLSSTASQYSASLKQDMQAVTFRQEACSNSSQRRYEARFEQTYIDLQNCLSGAIPVPEPTTTPAPTTTTTAAPINSGRYYCEYLERRCGTI